MRERLSDLLVKACTADSRRVVLSGDHGYALFDALRKESPKSFINVGVMEQAMVGMAAGLAKSGARPIVYGLSAFIPIRVLEQMKMDVCHVGYPVIFLGDGAGLVYSTLGASHQCGEDVAALKPLPGMKIFTPADAEELEAVFNEALATNGPCYIRIGKSDRPAVSDERLSSTAPRLLRKTSSERPILVTMGSMTAFGNQLAGEFDLGHLSVLRVKPIHKELVEILHTAKEIWVLEEHHRSGGLASTISDALIDEGYSVPKMKIWSLKDQFVHTCGSYQHALSEHQLSDQQVRQSFGQNLSSRGAL
ncbi:MAG: transketolase [Deltaproteobacteria bacterium]|nr:transketolase [Deltaproteobacteria bacterium]